MQRYFIDEKMKDTYTMNKDDSHHIYKVMRCHVGDEIVVVDTTGTNYICELLDEAGNVKVKQVKENDSEMDVDVTLIYALPKGDKFEFVLQKATELGVKRIVPLQSKRCVTKLTNDKYAKKKVRYQKILKEASEQSYRNFIPVLEDVISLKDIVKYLGNVSLVAYEETAKEGKHHAFFEGLSALSPGDKITVIVGSEGGFEESEVEQMEAMGVKRCSLGKRILRSETAPLYMLSVIGYSREVCS